MPPKDASLRYERSLRSALRNVRWAIRNGNELDLGGALVDLASIEHSLHHLLESTPGCKRVIDGQLSIPHDPTVRVARSENRR